MMDDRSKGFNFSHCGTYGFSTDEYGNDQVSMRMSTPNAGCKFVDIGSINFTDITPDEEVELGNSINPLAKAASLEASRRLSRKQAFYIRELVTDYLSEVLLNRVPNDAEIDRQIWNREELV